MRIEERIFKTYYKSLCHFAWKIVGDSDSAEDLVQDTFVAFFKRNGWENDEDSVTKSFLYHSVRNACLNHIRHEKVKRKYWSLFEFKEEDDFVFEMNIIHTELLQEIYRIVEEMPFSCQQVFRMGYLDGFSNLEITKTLQISVNTVKTQKQRGMKILLKKLNPEFLPLFIIFLTKI